MVKRTIVRLLLFGIPFGLSYWATRPGPPRIQTVVVCAYPGDQPGELRINTDPAGCSAPVSVFPAITAPDTLHGQRDEGLNIPF
jgi:hypothetical protein